MKFFSEMFCRKRKTPYLCIRFRGIPKLKREFFERLRYRDKGRGERRAAARLASRSRKSSVPHKEQRPPFVAGAKIKSQSYNVEFDPGSG